MKKILVLLLAVTVGFPLFAQTAGKTVSLPEAAEQVKQNYPWVNSQKLKQAVQEGKEALREITEDDFPVIQIKKHDFKVAKAFGRMENGQEVWVYYYNIEVPLLINEKVVVENGKQHIVYHANSSQTEPAVWQEKTLDVRQIVITVYPDNRLESIAEKWKAKYGDECLYQKTVKAGKQGKAQVIGLWNLLEKAYLFPDGRTAHVTVYVHAYGKGVDAVLDTYQRQCEAGNAGIIFNAQPRLEKIGLDAFPKKKVGVIKENSRLLIAHEKDL